MEQTWAEYFRNILTMWEEMRAMSCQQATETATIEHLLTSQLHQNSDWTEARKTADNKGSGRAANAIMDAKTWHFCNE